MRAFVLWVILLALGSFAGLALADGEVSAWPSDTGVIVPVDEPRAWVLDQHITITLRPREGPLKDPVPPEAVIRVEYVLSTPQVTPSKPLTILIGWATSEVGLKLDTERHRWLPAADYPPSIKLDGKPVPYRVLMIDDLADQYIQPWLERIDTLLESKPALKRELLDLTGGELRKDDTRGASFEGLVSVLAAELEDDGLVAAPRSRMVAAGVLGAPLYAGEHRDRPVQEALRWLDPTTPAPIDVYGVLYHRWGHDTRLLDPNTGALVDATDVVVRDEPPFGIFQFAVTLEPGKKHRLIVQYGQDLGGFSGADWSGLVYLMEPARRWGKWERTSIEIRAPRGHRLATRPPAKRAGDRGGLSVHRIELGWPCENLYISLRD